MNKARILFSIFFGLVVTFGLLGGLALTSNVVAAPEATTIYDVDASPRAWLPGWIARYSPPNWGF